MSELEFKSG